MTIKQITLGACLLATGSALAQDKTYTVKGGDTLSEIAQKVGVDSKSILRANHLTSANKLKLGQTLRIPSQTKTATKAVDANKYVVRSGDNDESIAKRLGVTPKEIRLANLGTNWTRLQIGQAINIPQTKHWFSALTARAAAEAMATGSTKAPVTTATLVSSIQAPKLVQRTYKVQSGDNDWIIAKRVGIKPSVLRQLNPGVKWTNLQIGKVLNLPGTKSVGTAGQMVLAKEPNLPRLRSRYAVVSADSVTIRRGPSMRFDSITTVNRGTRVLVLDRDGSWYKLRFPKGTEAWVRGDFLAPTKAPQLMVASNRSNTKTKKPKTTLVASRTSRNTRGGYTRKPTRDNGRPLLVASNAGNGLLDKANSFLGVRYRYGAASRSATDCSGFTTQVFRAQGVKLPRTAREQSGRGQKVGKQELKEGDLVFFNTRGSRVSHVGIYKGDGKFIHASSGKGKVMVSSLNEGYYQRRFAGARRVISSKPSAKNAAPKVAKKEEPKSTPVEPVTTPVEPKTSSPPDTNGGK